MINKIEFGLRLKEFGYSKFKTLNEFANHLDMNPATLQASYYNGRSLPGAEIIARLAALGCDLDWLFFGKPKTERPNSISPNKLTKGFFPVVNCIGAGIVTPYDDSPIEYISLPYNGMGVVLKVEGDSMADIICDGDYILVSTTKLPLKGQIAAVRLSSGEQFVKYYAGEFEQRVSFYSRNVNHKPFSVLPSEIQLMRKVVSIIRDLDDTIIFR